MSWLTIAWSMAAAACFTLAGVHLVVWSKSSKRLVHLLFALMAVGAGLCGMSELILLHTESISTYHSIIRWQHVPIFVLLVSMVWAVQLHFGTGRRWLAWVITASWIVCLVINFFSAHNLVFSEIETLDRVQTFGGESFTVARGGRNPWVILADLTTLLIIGFVADASIRLWRRGGRRRAGLIGASILVFIVAAGVHAPLVDASIVKSPYMIGFAFLAIVAAMSYALGSDAVRAVSLSREVESNERRWRSLLEGVDLLVIGADAAGRINYVNPFFERTTGRSSAEIMGQPTEELVISDQRKELAERVSRMKSDGPRAQSTWSVRCADGGPRSIVFSNVRLEKSDGSFAGVLSVGEDVTDRLRAESTARDLAGRLIHAQEEERSRVARDLHDDITQRLARLSIDAARIRRASVDPEFAATSQVMGEDLVRLSEDVHAIAYRLHPSVLEDLGLSEALASECERFISRERIPCEIRSLDLPSAIPRPVALGLFRVGQEALNNIGRHARATAVKVTLRSVDGGVQLAINDDGIGFEPSDNQGTPSMGLASMRERISYLGGELDIESSPGHGTTIVAWVPVKPAPES